MLCPLASVRSSVPANIQGLRAILDIIMRYFEVYYAPNFKEVGGAYCFLVVCPFVHPSIRPFVTLFDA